MKAQLFFNVIFVFVNSLLSLEQEHVFPPSKSCSPSAATDAWHSAVHYHPPNEVLRGCLLKDQTGKNLMLQVMTVGRVQQYCASKFCDGSMVCTLVCGLALSWRIKPLTFCLWVELDG